MDITITDSQAAFLRDLKHEMLTQDTCCQADPRFWMIEDYRTVYNVSKNDADEAYLEDHFGNIVARNISEIEQHIHEMEPQILEKGGYTRMEVENNVCCGGTSLSVHLCRDDDDEEVYLIADAEDAAEFFNDTDAFYGDYDVIYARQERYLCQGPLFATERAAEDYLRKYGYNHTKRAHPFAMTAYRSPEIAFLWELIKNTEW